MMSDYQKNCRPIRILDHDSSVNARLGGNPPDGIAPETLFSCTEYFATLTLDVAREMSIFNSFERGVTDERAFLKNKYVLHTSANSSLIQFVIHGPSSRATKDSELASSLSPHGLVYEPEEPDEDGWLDSNIYTGSKMGGYPFYWQNKLSIRTQGRELIAQGYTHLLQFAFPDSRGSLPSGSWPYGSYTLHIFVDNPANPIDIRYGWG